MHVSLLLFPLPKTVPLYTTLSWGKSKLYCRPSFPARPGSVEKLLGNLGKNHAATVTPSSSFSMVLQHEVKVGAVAVELVTR